MPASNTAFVSSSMNSGFPSVLATIWFITSVGSARPPVSRATMLSTSLRARRPSVKVLTFGRPTQGGSNSGRNVNSESRRKARLPDARLARDQHDLAFPSPGDALAFQQEIDLVRAADEISQIH